ncbi:MAG TPA: GatB/YqeY domain-containing protein [Flavobacteriaceae bacterium]|nr:GatB/YqeY domain-containing protein [Flavobacteriaceae bacterium]
MGLEEEVMQKMKVAMKEKNHAQLEALRAIRAAILNAKTAGDGQEINEEMELKILQRLVKQRLDSMQIFQGQNRPDLAENEESQAKIISEFLPEQLSEEEIEKVVDEIIAETGAESMKDMGKVMGMASKKTAGKADNKTISVIVKRKLS